MTNRSIKTYFQFAGNRGFQILLILCLGLAAALRLYDLGGPAYDIEEVMTGPFWAQQSLGFLLFNSLLADNYPPLHFALLWIMAHLFGNSATILRFPSVLFGLGSLCLLYGWAKSTNRKAAASAVLGLTTFCLYHLFWSQYSRMYAMMIFFAIGLLWITEILNSESGLKWFVGLGLFVFGALGTHFFCAIPVFLASLLMFLKLIQSIRTDDPNKSLRFAIRLFYSFGIPMVLLWSWYGRLIFSLLGKGSNQAEMQIGGSTLPINHELILSILGTFGFGTTWLLYVFVTLLLLGVWREIRAKRWQKLFYEITWVVFPFLVMALVPTTHFFDLSYTSSSAPVLWLWAAGGLTVIYCRLVCFWGWLPRTSGLLLFSMIVSGAIYAYPLYLYYHLEGKPAAIKVILNEIERLAPQGQILVYEHNRDINFIPFCYPPQKEIFFVNLKNNPGGDRKQELLSFFDLNPHAWLVQGLRMVDPPQWADQYFAHRLEIRNIPYEKLVDMGIYPRRYTGIDRWVIQMGYKVRGEKNKEN